MADREQQLSTARKWRGVCKASITRLQTRAEEAERAGNAEVAKQLMTKLDSLDTEFRKHHLTIIGLIDSEDTLLAEQTTLDSHDDRIYDLNILLQGIVKASSLSVNDSTLKISTKRLAHLESTLTSISSDLSSFSSSTDDTAILYQFNEQLAELKGELTEVRNALYTITLSDSDPINTLQAKLEKMIFDISLNIKKQLASASKSLPSSAVDSTSVKLPRIEIPTFDGNLLHWSKFWEQFDVAVHSKANLAEAEKLVYLQQALKGSAKQAIEGLSASGDHYAEAIACLKDRYCRPRLIHQAHVRMIVEAPSLKDGTGKEIRKLHDHVQQHLRALKSLGHEPPGPFITSLLEIKLDPNTMFEWQKHSHTSSDVPHYEDLLGFLDLRAQASESVSYDPTKKSHRVDPQVSRTPKHQISKSITSYTATVDTSMKCVACKKRKASCVLLFTFQITQ